MSWEEMCTLGLGLQDSTLSGVWEIRKKEEVCFKEDRAASHGVGGRQALIIIRQGMRRTFSGHGW